MIKKRKCLRCGAAIAGTALAVFCSACGTAIAHVTSAEHVTVHAVYQLPGRPAAPGHDELPHPPEVDGTSWTAGDGIVGTADAMHRSVDPLDGWSGLGAAPTM